MAEFAGVDKDTVRRWRNGMPPVGRTLVKVRVVLDIAGYEVEEVQRLSEPMRDFARSVGIGLISIESATELLDYANEKGVYDLILRGLRPIKDKEYRLMQFVDQNAERLVRKLDAFRRKLGKLPKAKPDILLKEELPAVAEATLPAGPADDRELPPPRVAVARGTHVEVPELALALALALKASLAMSNAVLQSPDATELIAVFKGLIGDEPERLLDNLADLS